MITWGRVNLCSRSLWHPPSVHRAHGTHAVRPQRSMGEPSLLHTDSTLLHPLPERSSRVQQEGTGGGGSGPQPATARISRQERSLKHIHIVQPPTDTDTPTPTPTKRLCLCTQQQGRLAQEPGHKREWHWQAIRTHHSNYRLITPSPTPLLKNRKQRQPVEPITPFRLSRSRPWWQCLYLGPAPLSPPQDCELIVSLLVNLAWAPRPAPGPLLLLYCLSHNRVVK